jgi:hypothetical protein
MAKRKNMKADKPMFTGRIMFDGNIQVRLLTGDLRTLRTDLCGMKLQKADPNKELLVLTKSFTDYNEIHTGYIVRTKQYDDQERPCFGLKHEPDADCWTIINYCDVIAWGYADGGLNDPTLFYSCQSTKEEEEERERRRAEKGMKTHAERLAEMEAEEETIDEFDEDVIERRGVAFKMDDEGQIHYHAVVGQDEELTNNATDLMHAAAKCYTDFRKEHPEVTEMRFYTDEPVEIKNEEN